MDKKQTLRDFLQNNIYNDKLRNIINAIKDSAIKIYPQLQIQLLDTNLSGDTSNTNIHGETTKKLDIIANNIFIEEVKKAKSCDIIVSEEIDEALVLNNDVDSEIYMLAIDPLDGSSNININGPLGSIFAVYNYSIDTDKNKNIPTSGSEQLLAGYVLYGSSTILALAIDSGLYLFVLNPQYNNFYLVAENVKMPSSGKICSVNIGNYIQFSDNTKKSIDSYINNKYSFRYMAAMVADIHRILFYGGIFLYPGCKETPAIGKLRLLYECNPVAFIMSKAGGMAVDGFTNIMDITISDIHQKAAIIAGSKDEVLKFLS